jgi:uncharacterized membrane protein (DUF2068 family)
MYIAGVIALYIVITFMELVPLWKNKKKKQIAAYFTIMMLSLIISISLVSGGRLPTISNILTRIFSGE